MLQEGQCA